MILPRSSFTKSGIVVLVLFVGDDETGFCLVGSLPARSYGFDNPSHGIDETVHCFSCSPVVLWMTLFRSQYGQKVRANDLHREADHRPTYSRCMWSI